MNRLLTSRCVILLSFLIIFSSTSHAESFHWVDRDGFHSVDSLLKVPLEHRRDLPMARHKEAFPFTQEEDSDGSMYLWFMFSEAGMVYPYTRAMDVPKSKLFRKVSEPQRGDIAWWKQCIVLYDSEGNLRTPAGKVPLKKMENRYGKATWYRIDLPDKARSTTAVSASADVLAKADAILARFRAAEVFHPHEEGDPKFEALTKDWERGEADLEVIRRLFPDSPQVLAKLGELYRLGHNLDIPGTWEKAEAFLLKAEDLDMNLVDAYLSLGAHYADTGLNYAGKAEVQFRKALSLAQGKKRGQALWGLSMSMYYQGRKKEAVQAVDRLIVLQPENKDAKRLRETMTSQDATPDKSR